MSSLAELLAEKLWNCRVLDKDEFNDQMALVRVEQNFTTMDETRAFIGQLLLQTFADNSKDGQPTLLEMTKSRIGELYTTIDHDSYEKDRLINSVTESDNKTIARLDSNIVKNELLLNAYYIQIYVLTGQNPVEKMV